MFKTWFIPISILIIPIAAIIYGAFILGITIDWAFGVIAALGTFFSFDLFILFRDDPNQRPRLTKKKNVLRMIAIALLLLAISNVLSSLYKQVVTWSSFFYMIVSMSMYIFLVVGTELLLERTNN